MCTRTCPTRTLVRQNKKLLTNTLTKLNKSRSFRSAWVFCMFAFFKCLLCANVYACVCDPVSITFYRLLDKSIFLTCIAAAASKRAVRPPVMGIHRKLCHTSSRAHGKSFLRGALCVFCFQRCKQVPIVTWPLTSVRAAQSSELKSVCFFTYFYCCNPLSAIFSSEFIKV